MARRRKGGRDWTDNDRAEVWRRTARGESLRAIEEATGIPKSTVASWMQSDRFREWLEAEGPAAPKVKSPQKPVEPDSSAGPSDTPEGPAIVPEVMEELMPKTLEAVLLRHAKLTNVMLEAAAGDLLRADITQRAFRLLDLNERAIDRAIMAGVPERDSEGNTYMAPPSDWVQFLRRKEISQSLVDLQKDVFKMVQIAIRLEREANGLDFAQELSASLSRVMSAGFTVAK